jgi:DNA-binding GntR family transcriptional regulator
VETGIDSINNLTGPRGTAEQVAERIREAIVLGKILPGTRLLEAQLAARLGVSRIPVREALARLEAEGLVERAPYQGARVMRLTVEQVQESFMLRSFLEGFATKLATPHITPEEIARLRVVIAQLAKSAKAGRHEELPPLAREIHSTIYNRCGSAKLIRWISELYNQFPKSQRLSYRFEKPVQEYRSIVDAIEAGNAELAGRLMSEHIESGARVIVKHYREILPA